MSHRSWKDMFIGFLIGGTFGALLFKTEKGKKIQKNLLKGCHKVSDYSHDFLNLEVKKKNPRKKILKSTTRTSKSKKKK